MYQVVKRDGMIADFNISKISLAIQKAFEATAADSYFEWSTEEEHENYRTYVRIMAELDWPAFLEYDPDLHAEIISCVKDEDAEGITDALYSHFGALFLKELEERFEESEVIRPERLPAIREALLLYQLGYYYGAVAILITQMEGILLDIDEYIIRTGRAYDEKNLRLIDTRYKVSNRNEKGLVVKTLLEAKDVDGVAGEYDYLIGYLRMKVLGDKLSEEELSEHANRHAICHGKQCNYGTKEHTLKTIICIAALEYVADVIANVDTDRAAG